MFSKDRQFKRGAGGLLLAGLIATTAFGADTPAATPTPTPAPQCQGGHRGDMDLGKMKARADQEFAAADTNHDGKISEAEFLAFKPDHGPRGGPGMHGMGGPGMGMGMGMGMGPHGPGGGPTPQERDAFQADLFKALDADHNGQLSAAEFSKAWETAKTQMKTAAFKKLDKNGDGLLTKDEFPPYVAKMSAMDANGDGTVTHDEMKAAHAAHGPQTNPPAQN